MNTPSSQARLRELLAKELLAKQYETDFPRIANSIRNGMSEALGTVRVLWAIEAALSLRDTEIEKLWEGLEASTQLLDGANRATDRPSDYISARVRKNRALLKPDGGGNG